MTDLRTLEKASIRAFVQSCSEHFTGRVLDYGCGKQPYRDIIESVGGTYFGFDLEDYPGNVSGEDVRPEGLRLGIDSATALHAWVLENGHFDAVLCTQVVQYVPLKQLWDGDFFMDLRILMDEDSEVLVLTYPTTWPEVEAGDLHRFTRAGMTRLLVDAGFVIERHERRAEITALGETFALGYGVTARA